MVGFALGRMHFPAETGCGSAQLESRAGTWEAEQSGDHSNSWVHSQIAARLGTTLQKTQKVHYIKYQPVKITLDKSFGLSKMYSPHFLE